MSFEKYYQEMRKKFGESTILTINDSFSADVEIIPTGSINLDKALTIGGIPRGRIIEIFGEEMSGKTTLSLHFIAEAQKLGKVAFIDAEHALNIKYAQEVGIDINSLIISQPETGEQAFSIIEEMVESGYFSLIVIDSVAALTPRAEIEGEFGDSNMGIQARLMSQAMRKLTGITSKAKTTLVFINQTRSTIGPFTYKITTGGNALKFYSTIRIKVKKEGFRKKGEESIGQSIKAEVVKNKLGIPYRVAKFDIRFGEGIDKYGEVLDLGEEKGLIEKSGAWYNYDNEKIGQGRENTIEFLKQNENIYNKLKLEISGGQDISQKKGRKKRNPEGDFKNQKKKK